MLYEMRVTSHYVVAAATEREAREMAERHGAAQLALPAAEVVCREIPSENAVPRGWRHRIPYGESGRRTCAQIARGSAR